MFAVDALKSPQEQRCRPDKITTATEFDNTLRVDVLQLVDRGEMPVDEDYVGKRPEMLGRLQLW
jgi:pyrimidine operon attenuation protein/uracil phosphoribosyltransferase